VAASTSLDSQIKIWDISQFTLQKTIDAGPMEAWSVGFSPDGKHIATGSHSGKINVWTVESGEKDRVLDTKSKFVMSCVYVSSLWNFFCCYFLFRYFNT
jgi:WD repeat-containing protein 61